MNETEHGDGGSFQLASYYALIIGLLGTLFLTTPELGGLRPDSNPALDSSLRDNTVPARLWEDPFYAKVRQHHQVDASLSSKLLRDAADFPPIDTPPPVLGEGDFAIVVPVPGGKYAELQERRRRIRYALLSALYDAGFTPDHPDHLQLWQPGKAPQDAANKSTDTGDGEIDTPPKERLAVLHESFTEERKAVVMWIDEEALRDKPLATIRRTIFDQWKPEKGGNRPKLYVIGPSTSDTLSKMVEEQRDDDLEESAPMITVVSTMATAPIPIASSTSTQLIRSTLTDDVLVKKLVDELALRGVATRTNDLPRNRDSDNAYCRLADSFRIPLPGFVEYFLCRKIQHGLPWVNPKTGKQHHIALFTEMDTLYGRAMAEAFTSALDHDPDFPGMPTANEETPPSVTLHHFPYMRGIDGTLSNSGESHQDKSADKTPAEPQADNTRRNKGNNQIDYVTMRADKLTAMDRDLRAKKLGRVMAIGILGTDTYDKILLLQVLRPKFPDAIFFTTDLDTTMGDAKLLPFVRNLVTVSPYPLSPNSDWCEISPRQTPMFRDNYQTAIYCSSRAIFSRVAPTHPTTPTVSEWGRSGPVAQQPSPRKRVDDGGLARIFVVALILLLIFIMSGYRTTPTKSAVITVLFATIAYCYPGIIEWFHNHSDELIRRDGTSIWPTVLIQSVAGVLALIFFLKGSRSLQSAITKIEDTYFPKTPPFPLPLWEKARSLILSSPLNDHRPRDTPPFSLVLQTLATTVVRTVLFRNVRLLEFRKEWKAETGKLDDLRKRSIDDSFDHRHLWSKYIAFRSFGLSSLRITIGAAAFFLFALLVVNNFSPPLSPVRGEFAYYVASGVGHVSGFLIVVLIFHIASHTQLCGQLIKHLNTSLEREETGGSKPHTNLGSREIIEFAGTLTAAFNREIYAPFFCITLMFIAQTRYFDNLTFTPAVLIMYGIATAYAWYSAATLRRRAEHIRENILDALVRYRMEHIDERDKTRIDALIEYIGNYKEGAFAGYFHQPVVHALIMPLSGVGGALGLDVLAGVL